MSQIQIVQDESKDSLMETTNEHSLDCSIQDSNLDQTNEKVTCSKIDTLDANDIIVTKKYFQETSENDYHLFKINGKDIMSGQFYKNIHLVGLNVGFELDTSQHQIVNQQQSLHKWLSFCDLIANPDSHSCYQYNTSYDSRQLHALENIYKLEPSVLFDKEKETLYLEWKLPFGFDNRVVRSPFVRGIPIMVNRQFLIFDPSWNLSITLKRDMNIKRIYVEAVYRCNNHNVSEKNIVSYREMNVFLNTRPKSSNYQNSQMLQANEMSIPTNCELRGLYFSYKVKNPNTNEMVYSSDFIKRIQIKTCDNKLLYDKEIGNPSENIYEGNFLFIPWNGMDTIHYFSVSVSCVNSMNINEDNLVIIPVASKRIKIVKPAFDYKEIVRVLKSVKDICDFIPLGNSSDVSLLAMPNWWEETVERYNLVYSGTPIECESIDEFDARMTVLRFEKTKRNYKPWFIIDTSHSFFNKLNWSMIHQLVCYGKMRLAVITTDLKQKILLPKWVENPHARNMKPSPDFHVKIDDRPLLQPCFELDPVFQM